MKDRRRHRKDKDKILQEDQQDATRETPENHTKTSTTENNHNMTCSCTRDGQEYYTSLERPRIR